MSAMTERKCSKCNKVLPASMFNKAKWLSSGLRPDCKICYSKAKKISWASKPKSEMALRRAENARLFKDGKRRCKRCDEVKEATLEHFAQAGQFLDTTCRRCVANNTKRWCSENASRAKINAAAGWANRYARKKQRTLKLSETDKAAIKQIYAKCREMNAAQARKYHVDHIVPLAGKYVCGLHVPWNLQILEGLENARKSNKC